jgi:sulfopyruvate decarboxylase subunit beta
MSVVYWGDAPMKRIDCLKALAEITKDDDLVVTNLGNTPHEWLSVRPSRANLYGMNLGQCTPVALGLALALPHRRVFALDGDGNLLLNLASLADTAHRKPSNLRIIVFDNEAYESPGGMPTATAHGVDLVQVAKGCGIKKSFVASTVDDFRERIKLFEEQELCLILAKIETGTIERPPYSSLDYKFNKYLFATYIEETEKKPVLRLRSKSPFTN